VGNVLSLQRFHRLQANAANEADAVIDGAACSISVALLSLGVDVVFVETQM
jgi:hypothetical protein